MPNWAGWLTRPFISAYWSWAGIVDGLQDNYRRWVDDVTDTWLAPATVCLVVLLLHLIIGLFLAYVGIKKPQWRE